MKNNKNIVYEHILVNGSTNRLELACILNISKPATTKIVNNLIQCGLLYESKSITNNQVGRNKVDIRINDTYFNILGLDVDSKEATFTVANASLQIIYEYHFSYSKLSEIILEDICKVINNKLSSFPNVVGMGVTLRGKIDTSLTTDENDVKGTIMRLISPKLQDATCFTNNVTALAEYLSLFEKKKNFFLVKYGPGIGGNFVIDGQVHEGANHSSGEFGHIDWRLGEGVHCLVCNTNKCLESRVSYQYLYSVLTNDIGENIHTSDIVALLNQTDSHILYDIFSNLAFAISTLAKSIDLKNIVIIGGLFANDIYFDQFEKILRKNYNLNSIYTIEKIKNYDFVKKVSPAASYLSKIKF